MAAKAVGVEARSGRRHRQDGFAESTATGLGARVFSLTIGERAMTVEMHQMRARANLLIFLGGILLVVFYANPAGSIVILDDDTPVLAEDRLLGSFEPVLPWLKAGGFALVGVGVVLKLGGRPRRRRWK